jgi:hypothetical protein
MAAEADPSGLDELTSETELDWSKSALKAQAGTPGSSPGPEGVVGTTRAQTEALPMAGKPNKALWLGLGAAALLGVGGVAYFKSQQHPEVVPPPVPPPVVQNVKPPPVEPPPKPVEPATVAIKVDSDPVGAEVVDPSGKKLGVTPLELALVLPATLKLSHDGFETKELKVTDASGTVFSEKLVKRKKVVGNSAPGIKTNR